MVIFALGLVEICRVHLVFFVLQLLAPQNQGALRLLKRSICLESASHTSLRNTKARRPNRKVISLYFAAGSYTFKDRL